MEITVRGLWTMIHGLGFGALYLLACSGAIVELWRRYSPAAQAPVQLGDKIFLRVYLGIMTLLAWTAVLTGTYIIYPLVSRRRTVGNRQSCRLSAAAAYVQSLHHWMALHRHGMERACRMARAHRYHHGNRGLDQVWGKIKKPSAASYRSPGFYPGIVSCRGHRGLLWRHAQQTCTRRGRPNHPPHTR